MFGLLPKGHRATKGSAAGRVLFFARVQTSCQQKTHCTEARSVATAPPRLLGPRFLPPRLPGERRDPGTTELWMAAKRTSNRQDLRSTEGEIGRASCRERV